MHSSSLDCGRDEDLRRQRFTVEVRFGDWTGTFEECAVDAPYDRGDPVEVWAQPGHEEVYPDPPWLDRLGIVLWVTGASVLLWLLLRRGRGPSISVVRK